MGTPSPKSGQHGRFFTSCFDDSPKGRSRGTEWMNFRKTSGGGGGGSEAVWKFSKNLSSLVHAIIPKVSNGSFTLACVEPNLSLLWTVLVDNTGSPPDLKASGLSIATWATWLLSTNLHCEQQVTFFIITDIAKIGLTPPTKNPILAHWWI